MAVEKDEATRIMHAWQGHRWRCLQMAIQAGAAGDGALTLAKSIDSYIITKSELEKGIEPPSEE